eukprot:958005-Amphidinium_carterae.2
MVKIDVLGGGGAKRPPDITQSSGSPSWRIEGSTVKVSVNWRQQKGQRSLDTQDWVVARGQTALA